MLSCVLISASDNSKWLCLSFKLWHNFENMKWRLSVEQVGGAAVLKVGCSIMCKFTLWGSCLGNSRYITAWVSLLPEPGSEHWATVMHVHNVVTVTVYWKKALWYRLVCCLLQLTGPEWFCWLFLLLLNFSTNYEFGCFPVKYSLCFA